MIKETDGRVELRTERLLLRPFKLDETIRNPVVISSLEMIASFLSVRSQWYEGDGPIPDDILPVIQDRLNLGRWNASFALYGGEVTIRWTLESGSSSIVSGPKIALSRIPGMFQVKSGPRPMWQALPPAS